MRMLRWICCDLRKDGVRNDDICERLGVAPVDEKLVQHHLIWFGHIQRRLPEAPVCSGVISRVRCILAFRGRPILTWEEFVKRDLKDWSITKELTLDRREWKLAIHVNLDLQFLLFYLLVFLSAFFYFFCVSVFNWPFLLFCLFFYCPSFSLLFFTFVFVSVFWLQ
jgi:hypothetical protein